MLCPGCTDATLSFLHACACMHVHTHVRVHPFGPCALTWHACTHRPSPVRETILSLLSGGEGRRSALRRPAPTPLPSPRGPRRRPRPHARSLPAAGVVLDPAGPGLLRLGAHHHRELAARRAPPHAGRGRRPRRCVRAHRPEGGLRAGPGAPHGHQRGQGSSDRAGGLHLGSEGRGRIYSNKTEGRGRIYPNKTRRRITGHCRRAAGRSV